MKKIIFFIRVQKNIIMIKNSCQKIRTGDIVVAVFLLYLCAIDASTLHPARHDTTRLRRRSTFSIIFFSAKGGCVRTKEKIRV
jgi:hypothetical protein